MAETNPSKHTTPDSTQDSNIRRPRRKRMSFREWRDQLGEAVPLTMVPPILKLNNKQTIALIKSGALPVQRFTSLDGRVWRYVRMEDIHRQRHANQTGRPTILGPGKLTLEGMRRALDKMINS